MDKIEPMDALELVLNRVSQLATEKEIPVKFALKLAGIAGDLSRIRIELSPEARRRKAENEYREYVKNDTIPVGWFEKKSDDDTR